MAHILVPQDPLKDPAFPHLTSCLMGGKSKNLHMVFNGLYVCSSPTHYVEGLCEGDVNLMLSEEWGCHSGESTHLPPMCPGFNSRTRRHMWVEFVVGSRPSSERFSPGTLVFPSPQKRTFLNSNSIWKVSPIISALRQIH